MQLTGKVLSVDSRNLAETTTADRAAGSTTLPVTDASSFDASGGQMLVEGALLSYASADYDLDVLTLEVPLAAAVASDSLVEVYPAAPERTALVDFGQQGEPSPVVIPHDLAPLIEDGIRTPAQQETVVVERREDGSLALLDLIMQPAVLTVAALDAAPTSDGAPPASSPTPTVVGGIGALSARWTPLDNADPVRYEVHLGTDSAFTPGQATLLTDTTGFSATIRTTPAGVPLAYDVTYWVRLVAYDDDGRADPSQAQSAQLMRVTGPDIAASYVYAGTINAPQIIGGSISADLTLSGSIKTAPSGARVELGAFGLVAYDGLGNPGVLIGTDGQASFRGQVQATTLTVTGGMSLRGTANEISRSASLTLAVGSTPSSNAPSVVVDYDSSMLVENSSAQYGTFLSLTPYSLERVGTQWLASFSDGVVRLFNSDGTFVGTLGLEGYTSRRGATQLAAGGPLYTITSAGRLARDEHRVNGVKQYQLNDPLTSLAAWTVTSGSVVVDSGKVKLAPAGVGSAAMRTSATFAMQGHDFSVNLAPTGLLHASQSVAVRIVIDADNYAQAETYCDGGVQKVRLRVVKAAGAPAFTAGIAYTPAQMANLVIREDESKFYIGTRSDAEASPINYQGNIGHTFTKAQLAACSVQVSMSEAGTFVNGAPSTQLVTNPDFESTVAGWTGSGTANSALSRTLTQKHGGVASMSVTAQSAGDTGATSDSGSDIPNLAPPITAGVTYTLSWWGRMSGSTSRQMALRFYWYDKTGAYMSASSVDGGFADNLGWTQHSASVVAPAGAAFIGYRVYMRGLSQYENFFVDDVSLTYAAVAAYADTARIRWVDSVASSFTPGTSAAIDNDGTNLIVASIDSANTRAVITTIDPLTFAVVSTLNTSAVPGYTSGVTLSGIEAGGFDFGAGAFRYVLKTAGSGQFYVFDSLGAQVTAETFPAAPGGSAGFDWDGSAFIELSTNSRLYKHTGVVWSGSALTMQWSAAFTWYDGNSAGTGLHETTPSPRALFSMSKRARLTITSTDIPNLGGTDDPDRIGVYLANSSAATLYQQVITAAGTKTAVLTSAVFSGTAAPTTNNFPGSTPAQVVSSDGSLVIKADGTVQAASVRATGMHIGRMGKSTAQAIATATSAVVQLNATNQAVGMTWDATNFGWRIAKAGRYTIAAQVCYAATPPAACRIEATVWINGAATALRTQGAPAITSSFPSVSLDIVRDLAVNDLVQLVTYQNSGSSYSTHTNVTATFLEVAALY